jgi:hypothetical protein
MSGMGLLGSDCQRPFCHYLTIQLVSKLGYLNESTCWNVSCKNCSNTMSFPLCDVNVTGVVFAMIRAIHFFLAKISRTFKLVHLKSLMRAIE